MNSDTCLVIWDEKKQWAQETTRQGTVYKRRPQSTLTTGQPRKAGSMPSISLLYKTTNPGNQNAQEAAHRPNPPFFRFSPFIPSNRCPSQGQAFRLNSTNQTPITRNPRHQTFVLHLARSPSHLLPSSTLWNEIYFQTDSRTHLAPNVLTSPFYWHFHILKQTSHFTTTCHQNVCPEVL